MKVEWKRIDKESPEKTADIWLWGEKLGQVFPGYYFADKDQYVGLHLRPYNLVTHWALRTPPEPPTP